LGHIHVASTKFIFWKVIAQSAYKNIVLRIVQLNVIVNALTTPSQLKNLRILLLQHCYNKIQKAWLAVVSYVN